MSGPDARRAALVDLLLEARRLVARPDNDFLYSSWLDTEHALAEVDGILGALAGDGPSPDAAIHSLLLPTGPMQELASDSGWGDAFVDLAARIDAALALPQPAAERADVPAGQFLCSICRAVAAEFFVDGRGDEAKLWRESFTGTLSQSISAAALERLRAALADGSALRVYEVDRELAPFYCPQCDASFCGEHWHTWDVFDDEGFHDQIRGRCPLGHERMLED